MTGESLVVKAMSKGRGEAQSLHEYLQGTLLKSTSLYAYHSTRRTTGRYYRDMMDGKDGVLPPS